MFGRTHHVDASWGTRRLPATAVGMWALAGIASLLVTVFVVAPGELAVKAYWLAHGLCAQHPERIFHLGALPLPFDARMTGLYGGAIMAIVPLLLGRRHGTAVAWPWLLALLAGIVAMAMDGTNSLRVDLGLVAWWPPDNRLRIVTGLVAGAGLGVAVVWLINLARGPRPGALLRPRDALIWSGLATMVASAILSGAAWSFIPITLLLLGGALLVLTGINYAVIGLMLPDANDAGQAAWHGAGAVRAVLPALALLLATAETGGLAIARWWLEGLIGRSPLP